MPTDPPGSSPLTRGKRWCHPTTRLGGRLIPAHAGKTPSHALASSVTGAHPRSRGENGCANIAGSDQAGSSPLTRGKQGHHAHISRRPRLIPAHAGKTAACMSMTSLLRAHPRSRGENEAARQPHGWETGSSPLTRGKQATKWRPDLRVGLIPAHAGKTSAWSAPTGDPGGSSPLTRGKLQLRVMQPVPAGLIPAHAGKTLPDLRFYRADRSDLGKP